MSRLSIQCGTLNNSQPYNPPRPVMGASFTFIPTLVRNLQIPQCYFRNAYAYSYIINLNLVSTVLYGISGKGKQ
jgi:hypothetical protein